MAGQSNRPAPRKKEPRKQEVEQAIAFEVEIAEKAAAIRAAESQDGLPFMDRQLYVQLLPLLRAPIPKGFLLEVSAGEGKPYASTGIRSVQVQMDRLDNVLTPLWWSYRSEFESEGKLCHVEVAVHGSDGEAIVTRDAWGGVNRANTEGNLRKGSFTNAAKQAFARIGPGHEVYIGVTDFDPDVDPDAAKEQARRERTTRIERDAGEAPHANGATQADQQAELRMLLAKKDGLEEKRHEADQGMQLLGCGLAQRLRELRSHQSADELNELIARTQAAADAVAANGDGSPA